MSFTKIVALLVIVANLSYTTANLLTFSRETSLISISGHVMSQDGKAFSNIQVKYSYGEGLGTATVNTDVNGFFTFSAVTPGYITFTANAINSNVQNEPSSFSFSSSVSVLTSTSNLLITLPSYVMNTITVYDYQGVPASGYSIFYGNDDIYGYWPGPTFSIIPGGTIGTSWVTWNNVVQTNAAGVAKVALFPKPDNLNYTIRYVAKNNAVLASVIQASSFLPINKNNNVVINLPKIINVEGIIKTANGANVQNMVGTWGNPVGGYQYTKSASSGHFSFATVSAGNMSMSFSNYYTEDSPAVPGCLQFSSSGQLYETISTVTITLPQVVSIIVHVVDESGTPLSGIVVSTSPGNGNGGPDCYSVCPPTPIINAFKTQSCVSVCPSPGGNGCRTGYGHTDATGTAVVYLFQDAAFKVYVWGTESSAGRRAGSSPLSLSSNGVVTLILPSLISVGGYFNSVGKAGPVAAAGLAIKLSSDQQAETVAYTDKTGHFSFKGVVAGKLGVTVTGLYATPDMVPSGWTFHSGVVLNVSTNSLNITLPMYHTHTIQVIDQLGATVPGALVRLFNSPYAYYTSVPVTTPIIAKDFASLGNAELYIGDSPYVTADATGAAQLSLFDIAGLTVQLGCNDPANNARVASILVSAASNTSLTFVLPSPPSPPRELQASTNTSANTTATAQLSWNPPTNNGGFPLQNFTITITPTNTSTDTNIGKRLLSTSATRGSIVLTVVPSKTSIRVRGLAAGTTYKVTVVASNKVGKSKPAQLSIHTAGLKMSVSPSKTPTTKAPYTSSKPPSAKPTTKPMTNTPTTKSTTKPITNTPITSPTKIPSISPRKSPTSSPSSKPSNASPSKSPTKFPSVPPTRKPSFAPTPKPSIKPTKKPTKTPIKV